MASAFAHRLFTRGHVKYVRFHGDRAAEWHGDARDGFLDGKPGRNEFHSRLSLAIRFDAFSPAPFFLVKTWGRFPPFMCSGNRRIKERDLDSADLHWGWCT